MPYDPTLVTWDGDNDPENPRNWPSRKKWIVTVLISLSTFASNFGIANMAPALGLISQDYHMTTSVERGLVIALYVLAFAVAPLVYAPFSEIFGRKTVLMFGLCLYLAFNTACAFAPSYEVLAVFRFFAGFGASAPLAVGGGLLTDVWPPEQRATAMAVFSLAPQMGPVLGPIMGGWITELLVAWKDIVYISSGLIAALLIAFIPFVKETYGPFILARRAARRRKEESNPELSTVFERKAETLRIKLVKGMVVPFVLLFREPLLQILVLYVGVLFAVFYLQKTTIPAVYGTVYKEKPGIASLHYLAIGLGLMIGGVIGGRRTDMEFRRLTVKNMGNAVPEFKLSIMRVFSFFPPVGLMLYSWSADQALPWAVSDLGLFIYAIGMSASVISAQAYLVECYALLAAPALLASVFVRSTMGFSAPLFGEAMYDALGLGGGGSMMAGICFAVGVPTPFLLFRFGPMLRARSTYANHKHAD
ncbi:MFS general substrate transporter [Tilletiopsis washingtonensis]|uniref:MFS general substrate transporter n=1 Tax=Tilletiopsis washingtonensis TaxID=58919 RepID=A0A316Z1X1_9BASI|nr:MFS general substrate transporter [Tilletiopsis washingtonensis]PWN95356.1 MFS general substrate transporter [Tilletiopsis washingtonensis]